MADDHPAGEPGVPVLDLAFDPGTLDALRAGVKAQACAAGLPEARAQDVVLAVHELAANAVSHGAGAGRLRIWKLAGALHCQVEDGEPLASVHPPDLPDHVNSSEAGDAAEASGQTSEQRLPSRAGHGLWLVRRVADRMRILSGARGTRATVAFDLPARSRGQGLPGGQSEYNWPGWYLLIFLIGSSARCRDFSMTAR
jgi:anti-sigma regulatory factor (Ser/Thr protein kinase)